MTEYDSTLFRPPAPLAAVTLRNEATGKECADVPMLIDSGTDVTVVPRTVLAQLAMAVGIDRSYEVIGFDGVATIAPVVNADLIFCRRRFRGQFLLTDQEWGIPRSQCPQRRPAPARRSPPQLDGTPAEKTLISGRGRSRVAPLNSRSCGALALTEQGLSARDAGELLGLSRQRVNQILQARKKSSAG